MYPGWDTNELCVPNEPRSPGAFPRLNEPRSFSQVTLGRALGCAHGTEALQCWLGKVTQLTECHCMPSMLEEVFQQGTYTSVPLCLCPKRHGGRGSPMPLGLQCQSIYQCQWLLVLETWHWKKNTLQWALEQIKPSPFKLPSPAVKQVENHSFRRFLKISFWR